MIRLAATALLLALFLALVLWAPALADDGKGTVRVENNSVFEIYVVIGGYNQGPLWKRSSQTYEFAFGSHKVEAEVGDEVAKKWVTLSPGSPTDEVTFCNDDFPELKPPR